ncbi:MAG: NADH-quinone oxidoreductase subunit L [Burkholderiales bacterium]|nr:NADH-quinone oxidoreductase subunit L [Burkholderiales bacterium]OJX08717.1 MAG: NADH-quinone oxidoreductase subunit L [Burkholderiales bacterium 70-64]
MKNAYLLAAFAPLAGALVAGLLGRRIGRAGAHWVTIIGVAVSFLASMWTLFDVLQGNTFNGTLYRWASIGGVNVEVGFLIDTLTATMMTVVTFVSLMVHIYTIGYMADDPGYQRFFSYISLFTFSMMMLVMANNFMQLFFGWEAVGLVSYLLIGFWYTRPSAIYANLKAFLVNRVGDFGFVLGIGLVLAWSGSLDYAEVFKAAPGFADRGIELIPGTPWSLLTLTCLCLFVGAMGKSAQVPLHVWLPDSMEGPTPISALIHAATMVTAGIFMVARMSPLFELSDTALGVVIVIGAITALFMGFLGIVQNDIKRVVAYSTLSQLGYMTVALGASAYGVAIFHLMTHAFFKALLFLGAGSVIIAMHHDQDIRNMGGLRKYMPITWITFLVGTLALIGTPFFSGFYSKDLIIEAAKFANVPGAGFAYFCVLAGVFVTAFYSFRLYFLVFHGQERWGRAAHGHGAHHGEEHHGLAAGEKPHETAPVVTIPLVLLAIPSVLIGLYLVEPMLFGGFFDGVIAGAQRHPAMATLAEEFHGWLALGLHALSTPTFWLALAGTVAAWYCYMVDPRVPEAIARRFSGLYRLLVDKYYFDRFNEIVLAGGARLLGRGLWKGGDQALLDGVAIDGSARLVGWFSGVMRLAQTGRLNTYAITMIVGVALLMLFVVLPMLRR